MFYVVTNAIHPAFGQIVEADSWLNNFDDSKIGAWSLAGTKSEGIGYRFHPSEIRQATEEETEIALSLRATFWNRETYPQDKLIKR